ncbi:hypothetical protein FHT97_005063 [Rhizobium sp. BK399]|nr:hypothetical protein [Rhizobium sp. BK181]MBB3544299.1 hypothetical protein [Rhizobium sp. BK399]MCS3742860.1 hypothetical protein [Rhizobium sp. BK661]
MSFFTRASACLLIASWSRTMSSAKLGACFAASISIDPAV